MKHLFFTKIFPAALTASLLAVGFFASDQTNPWFWITTGFLSLLHGGIFIWLRLKKIPNLKITDEEIFVNGLRISRRDIAAWRCFRSTKDGERGRYFEVQLNKAHPSRFEWKLAKLFESAPSARRSNDGIPLAKEPRIIASLTPRDLSKDEIEVAMNHCTTHPEMQAFPFTCS